MNEINLGDEVEDLITGFRGIVTVKYNFLYQKEPRFLIQPPCDFSGVLIEPMAFSVDQLKIMTRAKVVIPPTGLNVVK